MQQRSETVYSLIYSRDIRSQISFVLRTHTKLKNKYATRLVKLIMQEDELSYFDIYLFIRIHCFQIINDLNNEEMKILLEKFILNPECFI